MTPRELIAAWPWRDHGPRGEFAHTPADGSTWWYRFDLVSTIAARIHPGEAQESWLEDHNWNDEHITPTRVLEHIGWIPPSMGLVALPARIITATCPECGEPDPDSAVDLGCGTCQGTRLVLGTGGRYPHPTWTVDGQPRSLLTRRAQLLRDASVGQLEIATSSILRYVSHDLRLLTCTRKES